MKLSSLDSTDTDISAPKGPVKLSTLSAPARSPMKLSKVAEPPVQDDNALEDTLNKRKKELEDQQKAAYAKEQEIAKQEAAQNQPENWSSTRFKKEAPKPQTPEEQAMYDATVAKKELTESQMADKLLPPELRRNELEIGPPKPDKKTVMEGLGKIVMGGLTGAAHYAAEESGAYKADPAVENAKSHNIYAIQQNLEREARLDHIYKNAPEFMKEKLGEGVVEGREESLKNWKGIPLEEIRQEYKELIRRPEITGMRPDTPTFEEFLSIPMTGLVAIGLMSNPIGVALGVAGFMAIDEIENKVVSSIKKRPYILGAGKGISDLLPEQASEATAAVVDMIDFIGKGLLLGGIGKRAPKISEYLTREIINKYNLPREVFIDPVKIRSIFGTPSETGNPITPEELDLVTGLGLNAKGYKEAFTKGVTIKVPVEKITTLRDRPYWKSLKEAIGLKATPEKVVTERPTKPGVKLSEIGYEPSKSKPATPAPKTQKPPQTGGKVAKTPIQEAFEPIIQAGGGTWLGSLPGFTKKDGTIVPTQIQFQAPSGDTLALPMNQVSAENVKAKISALEKKYREAEKGGGETPESEEKKGPKKISSKKEKIDEEQDRVSYVYAGGSKIVKIKTDPKKAIVQLKEGIEHNKVAAKESTKILEDLKKNGAKEISENDIRLAGGDEKLALERAINMVRGHVEHNMSQIEQYKREIARLESGTPPAVVKVVDHGATPKKKPVKLSQVEKPAKKKLPPHLQEIADKTKGMTDVTPPGFGPEAKPDFGAPSRTAEDFELNPKKMADLKKGYVAISYKGKVFAAKIGSTLNGVKIFNHADLIEAKNIDFFDKKLIPGFISKAGKFVEQYPPEAKVIKVRPQRKFDVQKAVDAGDIKTIVIAYGGLNRKAEIFKNFAPSELKKISFLFKAVTKKTGRNPDDMLQSLAEEYPQLFGQYESDHQMIRALIDGTADKRMDVDKLIAEKEALDAKDAAEYDPATAAEADRIAKEELDAERSNREREAGAGDQWEAVKGATPEDDIHFFGEIVRNGRRRPLAIVGQKLVLDQKTPFMATNNSGEGSKVIGNYQTLEEAKAGVEKFFESKGVKEQGDLFGEEPTRKKREFGEARSLKQQAEVPTDLEKVGIDEKQLKMFPTSETEAAHGSEAKKEANHKKVLDSTKKAVVKVGDKYKSVYKSPFALRFKETGKLSFPSLVWDGNPASLAFAFRFLHEEAVENFWIGFMKDGVIQAVELHATGTVDEAAVHPYEMLGLGDHVQADQFFLVHNHPSGKVEPSPADLDITAKITSVLGPQGIEYAGHLILEGDQFGYLSAKKTPQVLTHEQYAATKDVGVFKKYLEWSAGEKTIIPGVGEHVRSPQALFDLAKGIQTGDNEGLLVLLDKGMRILNVLIFPKGQLSGVEAVRYAARARATGIVTINSGLNGDNYLPVKKELSKIGVRFFDNVEVLDANSYRSWSEHNAMDPGETYGPKGISEGTSASYGSGSLDEYEKQVKAAGKVKGFKLFEAFKALGKKYVSIIGERYIGAKGAAGTYKHSTDTVRTVALNAATVVIHEFGHGLDFKGKIVDEILRKTGTSKSGNPIYDSSTLQIRKEMTDLYTNHYTGGLKTHKLEVRMREGIATLLQKYIEKPSVMLANYPTLVKEFLEPGGRFYKPVTTAFLKDVQAVISQYQSLDDLGKVAARVTTDPQQTGLGKDTFLNFIERINTFWADNVFPISKMAGEAGVEMTAQDPALWLRMYNNSNALILNNIKGGRGYWTLAGDAFKKIHDFNWKNVIESLQKNGKVDDFGYWLVARDQHFQYKDLAKKKEEARLAVEALKTYAEMAGEGMNMAGDRSLQEAIEEAKGIIQRYEDLKKVLAKNGFSESVVTKAFEDHKDVFKDEADQFDKLVRADLQLLADPTVGLITPKQYAEYSSKEGYASLKRDVYDEVLGDEDQLIPVKVGKTRISSIISRKGSELTIINPLYNAIRNHAEIVRKSLKQIVYNKIGKLAKNVPGLIQQQPLKRPYDPRTKKVSYPQEKDPNIIMARDANGKRVPYLVSSFIKKVVDEILEFRNIGIFEELLTSFNRIFSKGTTGLYAPFTVTNFTIDQISAVAQTRNNYIPVYDALNEVLRTIANRQGQDYRFFEEYMILGGEKQTFMGWQDMNPSELFKKISGEKNVIMHILGAIEAGENILGLPSKYSEIITRASEYIKARKAGKPQIVALEEAGEVTAPFHHTGQLGGGSLGKTVVKSIPFFNPGIQVFAKYLRTMTGEKSRNRAIFTYLAITAALLGSQYYLYEKASRKQKDQYNDLQPEELSNNIFLPNPWGDNLIKIRIPQQMSGVGTIINMALANHYRSANYTAGDFIAAGTQILPTQANLSDPVKAFYSWIPQILKPLIEVTANVRTFPKVIPLEGMSQKNKTPGQRFTQGTLPLPKWMGRKLGVSPIMVQHLFLGYMGRVARPVLGEVPFSKDSSYNPLVKKYYFQFGRMVQRYYDIKERNAQILGDYKNDRIKLSDAEYGAAVERRGIIKGIEKEMKEFKQEESNYSREFVLDEIKRLIETK